MFFTGPFVIYESSSHIFHLFPTEIASYADENKTYAMGEYLKIYVIYSQVLQTNVVLIKLK